MLRGLKKRLEKILLSSLVFGSSFLGGCDESSKEGEKKIKIVDAVPRFNFENYFGSSKKVERKRELDEIIDEALKRDVEDDCDSEESFSEEELGLVYGEKIFCQDYEVDVFKREGKSKKKTINLSLYQNENYLVAEYVSEEDGKPKDYKRETGLGWSCDLSHPGFISGVVALKNPKFNLECFSYVCIGGESRFRKALLYDENQKAKLILDVGDKAISEGSGFLFGESGKMVYSKSKELGEVLAKRAEEKEKEYLENFVLDNFGSGWRFFRPEGIRESGFIKGGVTKKVDVFVFDPLRRFSKGFYVSNIFLGNANCQGGFKELEILVPFDFTRDWNTIEFDSDAQKPFEMYVDFDSGKVKRVSPFFSSRDKFGSQKNPQDFILNEKEMAKEGFDLYVFQDSSKVKFLEGGDNCWLECSRHFPYRENGDGTFYPTFLTSTRLGLPLKSTWEMGQETYCGMRFLYANHFFRNAEGKTYAVNFDSDKKGSLKVHYLLIGREVEAPVMD